MLFFYLRVILSNMFLSICFKKSLPPKKFFKTSRNILDFDWKFNTTRYSLYSICLNQFFLSLFLLSVSCLHTHFLDRARELQRELELEMNLVRTAFWVRVSLLRILNIPEEQSACPTLRDLREESRGQENWVPVNQGLWYLCLLWKHSILLGQHISLVIISR